MKELKVGDLFTVYSSELKYVDLSSGGSFLLENINKLEEYNFPLTTFMCMYLGDNLCEEYYTGIKMQINNPIKDNDEYHVSIYAKHNHYSRFSNMFDGGKSFRELDKYTLAYPLIIEPVYIHDTNLYVVCEDNNEENTKNVINTLNELAKKTYLESKTEYINEKYDEAVIEDMKISFQKRKKL